MNWITVIAITGISFIFTFVITALINEDEKVKPKIKTKSTFLISLLITLSLLFITYLI